MLKHFAVLTAGVISVILFCRALLQWKEKERKLQSSTTPVSRDILVIKNLTETLNQTLPPESALEAGLKQIAGYMGASTGWILTITPDKKAALSAGYHLPAEIDLAQESGRTWELCRCLTEALEGRFESPLQVYNCERLKRIQSLPERLKHHISIPIRSGGKVVGILNLMVRYNEQIISPVEKNLLLAIGDQFGGAVERARLFKEVRRLAITDSLTGLYNRRYFIETVMRDLERAQRYQRPFALALLDIDHFKQINDMYGHLAGDEVLQAVAQVCVETLRKADTIGRYGGEEIIILMPETSSDQAMQALERLRKNIAALRVNGPRGVMQVTASIGVANMQEDETVGYEKLFEQVDRALYQAKEAGRNRVVAWQEISPGKTE